MTPYTGEHDETVIHRKCLKRTNRMREIKEIQEEDIRVLRAEHTDF